MTAFATRAAASAAWFDLSKDNVSTPVLEPGIDNSSVQFLMKGVQNWGFESEFHGEIAAGLQLLASYAYIDSRIRNDLSAYVGPIINGTELIGATGDRLFGVPRHGGSVWTTYSMPGGPLRGLKLGMGAVIRGRRAGDNLNDYTLPGFAKCSALAAYGWRAAGTSFSLQMNVDNLFNERYFESLSGTRTVVPGAPRRWTATLRAQF